MHGRRSADCSLEDGVIVDYKYPRIVDDDAVVLLGNQ